MIAIPDFTAGAMENWGLITYRETALVYEAGVSSASNKQRVCSIVAHELAHQVSMQSSAESLRLPCTCTYYNWQAHPLLH